MAHVLIGFAEALPAPEVVFSLLNAGHRVSAFARRGDLPLAHLPLSGLTVIPAPEQDADAASRAFRDLVDGADPPDFVLPLDDGGLWLTAGVLDQDPRMAGAAGDAAALALDKIRQVKAAQAAGLDVPSTVVVRTPGDLDTDLPFPAIAKPAFAEIVRDGRLTRGDATYLPDRAAAETLRDRLKPDMAPLLVQPLVSGVGEGVFGFATADGVLAWSGHRRVRMMNPHGSGSSACMSIRPDAALRGKVQDFLDRIGWRGPFMVELLCAPDGTPWFMELNGRMWGSLALARDQGFEYPAWAVELATDPAFRPVAPTVSDQPITVRHLGRDLVHLLFVLRGPKSDFHRATWPRLLPSIGAVLKPAPGRVFYNHDPRHPWYFLRDAVWTLRRKVFER